MYVSCERGLTMVLENDGCFFTRLLSAMMVTAMVVNSGVLVCGDSGSQLYPEIVSCSPQSAVSNQSPVGKLITALEKHCENGVTFLFSKIGSNSVKVIADPIKSIASNSTVKTVLGSIDILPSSAVMPLIYLGMIEPSLKNQSLPLSIASSAYGTWLLKNLFKKIGNQSDTIFSDSVAIAGEVLCDGFFNSEKVEELVKTVPLIGTLYSVPGVKPMVTLVRRIFLIKCIDCLLK